MFWNSSDLENQAKALAAAVTNNDNWHGRTEEDREKWRARIPMIQARRIFVSWFNKHCCQDPKINAHFSGSKDERAEVFFEEAYPQITAMLASAPAPASGGVDAVRVKALEWHRVTYGWLAFEEWYRIEDQGPNWPTERYWLYERGERLGKFDTFEQADATMFARHEQRIRSALSPAATPVSEAGGEAVHPLAAFPDGLHPGLYRIHWKSGGASEAAIGMQSDGTRWIAPTNWIRPGMVASAGEWGEIEHAERIATSEPAAWQITNRASGSRDLAFAPLADLPFNRERFLCEPLYLAKPASSLAGGEPTGNSGLLLSEASADDAPRYLSSEHADSWAKGFNAAVRALSQSTSAGRVGE